MNNDVETKKVSNFNTKLNKYKRNLKIKNKIHEAWLGILHEVNLIGSENDKFFANPFMNGNITMHMDRMDHKKDLTYYYKRMINFLYQENATVDKDKNKISLVFNEQLYADENDKENVSEKKQTNINDFIEINEKKYSKSIRKIMIGKFIYGIPFQAFLAIIVIFNSIMVALQGENQIKNSNDFRSYFFLFEIFSNSVFLMELFLKWYYGFRIYWYSAWNIFDFVLVIVSIIQFFTQSQTNTTDIDKYYHTKNFFSKIRVFRALRSLRSLSIFSDLQILVESILKSTFDIINIVLVMLLTMVMLSLFGFSIFGESNQNYFQNLDRSMMSCFYCATSEGLSDLFNAVKDDILFMIFWRIFIVIMIIILAFILINLIAAVVVTNMANALQEKYKKKKIESELKLIEGHEELSQNQEIDHLFSEKFKIIKSNEIARGRF